MAKTPVGVQLYVLRDAVAQDLAGALKRVAEIGYQGAEPWGYGGEELAWMGHSAADVRKMYDDAGLICCGIHLQPQALQPAIIERTIEFNRILGNRFLVMPSAAATDSGAALEASLISRAPLASVSTSPRMASRAGISELAGILNTASELLRPHGMFCGYHAHGFDFGLIDGEPAWHHLFRQCRDDVIMQMDNGNTMTGDGDPIAALKLFPGRARTVHVKDFGGPAGSTIGGGTVDWDTLWRVYDTLHRPEWYVVEEGDGSNFDIPAASFAGSISYAAPFASASGSALDTSPPAKPEGYEFSS